MAGRTIAIGDIHGCSKALGALIDAIAPRTEDTIVTLGDYIDRGPDSRGVLDKLIALAGRCRLIPLMGNHEEKLLDALRTTENLRRWLVSGGTDTLRSYGWIQDGPRRALADWIPEPHRKFLTNCRPYYETATHVFLHAGFVPELPMDEQPGLALRWRVTDARTAVPHSSGKVAVVGHTPQVTSEVLDLGFLICIDTNCIRDGWLDGPGSEYGPCLASRPCGKAQRPRLKTS
ncbi:MAG TPA: metallophosphoesterase [Gemmata sp.]|jgi:serine/threonine protein phosphatase 1|nr:metallophosphoesterase [Gemmata sp.]